MTPPGASRARRLRDWIVGQPHHRNAAVVMTIALLMVALFALSYSLALGRPTPHHVPIGLVTPTAATEPTVIALEQATGGNLDYVIEPTEAAAAHAIEEQRIYGALVLSGRRSLLLISSAAGTSVARLFEQAAGMAAELTGRPLPVRDLHPTPSTDPNGLVSFYVTLAASILGFVTMFQLRANASGLSLEAWYACVAALAVIGGGVLAGITDPLIGALRGSFLELWAALSMQIAVAALFNCTMITVLGRWAMIPTWGFFVALGNAASGGAVAPPLLPPFYAFVGRFLPSGATVQTIRNAIYFPGAQHAEPWIVQGCWLVGTLLAFTVAARRRGVTPGTR